MPGPPPCPVAATLALLAGRWKPTILLHLREGPRRFNQLRRLIPGITQRMLTYQLRQLERDGVISRTVVQGRTAHVEYAFTARGRSLGDILDAMERWWRVRDPAQARSDRTLPGVRS